VSLRERVEALEAENERLCAAQERLFGVLERLTVAVERLAGVEPSEALEALPCRVGLPPARTYRRVRGGERP